MSDIEELFDTADDLQFNQLKYDEAIQIYNLILTKQKDSIDAINSIANCNKMKYGSKLPALVFDEVLKLYLQVLLIDANDIEANFSLGLLFLQSDLSKAIFYFNMSVSKDNGSNEVWRAQFAKAYYNIGMS